MDIEQGNVITTAQLAKIHVGMGQEQVTQLLGTPVLDNTLADNRLNYVYTFQPGYGPKQQKHLAVVLNHGRVQKIEKA